ncbi:MAG: hypothetical protein WA908_10065 [Pontixanthobacter sp.]
MIELIEANWPLFLIVLVIGILIAWWVFVAMRRTSVETDRSDVLDAGKGPAARNQALMDAPPAADTQISERPATDVPAKAAPTTDDSIGAGPQSAAQKPEIRETIAVTPTEVNPVAPANDPVMANTVRPTAAAADRTGSGDDLTRIKGVGPKLRSLLTEHDVTTFAQIAGWTDSDIDAIDAKLGKFQGRIRRDDWVAQARMLESGDTAEYESRFGKL